MKQKKLLFLMFIAILLFQIPFVAADDMEIFGLEAEELLNFGSALLAIALFVVTAIAYKRDKRKRLRYVCAAFLAFALKGLLNSSELFFREWFWVEPAGAFLEFVVLLLFFIAMVKK